jgi:hypothetical protein
MAWAMLAKDEIYRPCASSWHYHLIGLQMTPGTTSGLEFAARFPHPQICGYEVRVSYACWRRKRSPHKSNRRSGNPLPVRVFEARQVKQEHNEGHSIQARSRQRLQPGLHTQAQTLQDRLFGDTVLAAKLFIPIARRDV